MPGIDEVAVDRCAPEEAMAAVGVVSRALHTNPTSVAAFGEPALPRLRMSHDLFAGFVPTQDPLPYVARLGAWIVGTAGLSAPGECVANVLPPELVDPAAPPPPIGDPGRMLHVAAVWGSHDLDERHWHIGPVGVDPAVQGLGVGTLLLREVCAHLDREGEIGWLETDKPENVVFYARFGFAVADEADVLGAHNWWMRRDPLR